MADYISTARAFFDDVKARTDPFVYLSSLVNPADPFFEEEWIDFKGQPRNDDDAKRIWSKALSGYANLTDGLIVWGIDARKQSPREIDAASSLKLIPDPHAFESKLRDWIRDATNPPIMGVEYESYPGRTGEGFVVCLVPESGHKPHRAAWSGRHYYYRAGDDFLEAEPAMLRLLFYPRNEARFEIDTILAYSSNIRPQRTTINVQVYAVIKNFGNASAYEPYISVFLDARQNSHPSPWLSCASQWNQISMNTDTIMMRGNVPLHPNLPLPFLVSNRWEPHHRVHANHPLPSFSPFGLEFSVYCRDSPMRVFRVEFFEDDLLHSDRCQKKCVEVKT